MHFVNISLLVSNRIVTPSASTWSLLVGHSLTEGGVKSRIGLKANINPFCPFLHYGNY